MADQKDSERHMDNRKPETQAPVRVQPDGSASLSAWKETQRLLNDAILALNALSNHLREVPDEPRMYKATQALHKLWEIE